jgi:hypothetical protein
MSLPVLSVKRGALVYGGVPGVCQGCARGDTRPRHLDNHRKDAGLSDDSQPRIIPILVITFSFDHTYVPSFYPRLHWLHISPGRLSFSAGKREGRVFGIASIIGSRICAASRRCPSFFINCITH